MTQFLTFEEHIVKISEIDSIVIERNSRVVLFMRNGVSYILFEDSEKSKLLDFLKTVAGCLYESTKQN